MRLCVPFWSRLFCSRPWQSKDCGWCCSAWCLLRSGAIEDLRNGEVIFGARHYDVSARVELLHPSRTHHGLPREWSEATEYPAQRPGADLKRGRGCAASSRKQFECVACPSPTSSYLALTSTVAPERATACVYSHVSIFLHAAHNPVISRLDLDTVLTDSCPKDCESPSKDAGGKRTTWDGPGDYEEVDREWTSSSRDSHGSSWGRASSPLNHEIHPHRPYHTMQSVHSGGEKRAVVSEARPSRDRWYREATLLIPAGVWWSALNLRSPSAAGMLRYFEVTV